MSATTRHWQARLPFFYGWVIVGVAFCMGFFGLELSFAAALLARPFGIVSAWGGVYLMALSADLLGSYDVSIVVTTVAWLLCAAALYVIRPPRRRAAPVTGEIAVPASQ